MLTPRRHASTGCLLAALLAACGPAPTAESDTTAAGTIDAAEDVVQSTTTDAKTNPRA